MKKYINLIFGIIFLICGIACIVGFVFLKQNSDEFMKDAVGTTAEIIEIEEEYDSLDDEYDYNVFVEFEVDGKRYTGKLNTYNSAMTEGDKVEIYYDPKDPDNFRASDSEIFNFIFIGVGVIFAIVGTVLIVGAIKKSKKIKNLKASGRIITAEINDVIINRNTTVNNRHPYQIICSANIDGVMFSFKSDDIWFDISMIVSVLGVRQVQVYVNPMNPQEYHVDIDSLKQYLNK